jgi:hypothetical protein
MKLRTRISVTAIAAAAAAGTTGAFLVPAASAQPVPQTYAHARTLKFTSVQQAAVNFSPTTGAQQDKDVNPAGKVIGFDVLRFSFNPKTKTAAIGATVDLPGGFLYGQLRESEGPVSRGTVTGGTGAFQGATGTITATSLDENGSRTAVTITYCP